MGMFKNNPAGHVRAELRGTMAERFLNACAAAGLELISVSRRDKLTLEFIIQTSGLREAESIAQKSGCEIRVVSDGCRWKTHLRRRLFPAICAVVLVGLLFWARFHIWEIEISGNSSVRDGEILSALSSCGIESGAFWPDFSPDNIRSEMLERIPELSWFTVNVRGSKAEVLVVERREKPEMVFEGEPVSIVAGKTGFIRQVSALEGQSLVRRGDLAKKGDVLISGLVESSFGRPKLTRAQGSVLAETDTEYTAVIPPKCLQRRYSGQVKSRFAIIIGNNRINFYSDSSISDAFCDKIISVWNFEIKGLFRLPLSFVREQSRYYETEELLRDEYSCGRSLESCLYGITKSELGEGELISEKLNFSQSGDLYTASLRVRCLEEIGTHVSVSPEEISRANEKYTEKADDE